MNRCQIDTKPQRYNLCGNDRDYQIYFFLRGPINENIGERVGFLIGEDYRDFFDTKDGPYETAIQLVKFLDGSIPHGPRWMWPPRDLPKAILVRDYLEKWALQDDIDELERKIAETEPKLEKWKKALECCRRELENERNTTHEHAIP